MNIWAVVDSAQFGTEARGLSGISEGLGFTASMQAWAWLA